MVLYAVSSITGTSAVNAMTLVICSVACTATDSHSLIVADVPPAVVTMMSTVPAGTAGDVAVIDVAELTVTLVAGCPVPNSTVVAPTTKFVPVIVTEVPPATGPALGAMPVTVGAAALA